MGNRRSASRIGVNTLTGYLRELRAQPLFGEPVLSIESRELPLKNGENRENGEESGRKGAEDGGEFSAQASAEFTREDAPALLLQIATDGKDAMSDRLAAVRIHSTILGFNVTDGDVWSVIAALANGGTKSQ